MKLHFIQHVPFEIPAYILNWAEENAKKVNPKAHLFLQPEWSRRNEILPHILTFIKKNTKWMLSLQTHKYIGIP